MEEYEYIKKEDILKFIENIEYNHDIPKNYGTLLDIMRYIRKMPTIQPEHIINQLKELPHGNYTDDYGKGFSAGINAALKIIKEVQNG